MHFRRNRATAPLLLLVAVGLCGASLAGYTNYEASHVHPIDRTPSGARLLVVNTPDALLEVFSVLPGGELALERSIPVGLEPVSVVARADSEAWVVNQLSDSVSIVDLDAGLTTETLFPGDEPSDVEFAGGRAFVAVSQQDRIQVYTDTGSPVGTISINGRDVRALAASNDGTKIYAVVLRSGNGTTIAGIESTFPGVPTIGLDPVRLNALDLRDLGCSGAPPPPYPPLPTGIARNPALLDPPDALPKVGLIVRWDESTSSWRDEINGDWSHCLPYRPADHDLFVIDVATLAVSTIDSIGTSLFEVSVQPGSGKIWVPHTEARNFVRFEHELGVQGHVVDNRIAIVDPSAGNSVTQVDLNTHINRGSDPATNLAERAASVSQPGMMVWNQAGSVAYLTAIGSRKLFRVDGSCSTGSCIFGATRSAPDAVEVGEGPTGVALDEANDRLYVLDRIDHSVSIVRASDLTLLDQIPLHDPSPASTRDGRRFLYDSIDGSGHGDASCASCHLSGDHDGLAWDLGDPTGDLAPYATAMDNVRFVVPTGGGAPPTECPPALCAAHDGFDPQKGPMTTQTLRGMLEPLHWRGDRATMNDFNAAFVGLMGTADVGPINGKPAGLSAPDMESFRQFSLAIRNPPNPYRNADDSTPCGPRAIDPLCEVKPHGALFGGNPSEGALLYDTHPSDGGNPCVACHTHPFGAGGGTLGGVPPAEPTSPAAAALFNGDADGSPHSDLKIPHLRNMYEKFGPVYAAPGDNSQPPTAAGFGHVHDGGFPDLYRFFSAAVFNLSASNQAQQVRDMTAFMFHFPTETRPAVGRQVTVPQGTPPTGSAEEEALLSTLIGLGDQTDPNRHCELVVSSVAGGVLRYGRLVGGAWTLDAAAASPLSTQALREAPAGPLTFTCAPIDSGARMGGDRDEDATLNLDDCAPADGESWNEAQTIVDLTLDRPTATELGWSEQASAAGPSVRYDVLSGSLDGLDGFVGAGCLGAALELPQFIDPSADPAPGEGIWYVIRAANPCGAADPGAGRTTLVNLECP